jgi:hypothetical protein
MFSYATDCSDDRPAFSIASSASMRSTSGLAFNTALFSPTARR